MRDGEALARHALANFVSERLAELIRHSIEESDAAGEPLSERQKIILIATGARLLKEIS